MFWRGKRSRIVCKTIEICLLNTIVDCLAISLNITCQTIFARNLSLSKHCLSNISGQEMFLTRPNDQGLFVKRCLLNTIVYFLAISLNIACQTIFARNLSLTKHCLENITGQEDQTLLASHNVWLFSHIFEHCSSNNFCFQWKKCFRNSSKHCLENIFWQAMFCDEAKPSNIFCNTIEIYLVNKMFNCLATS